MGKPRCRESFFIVAQNHFSITIFFDITKRRESNMQNLHNQRGRMETTKHILDFASFGATIASIAGWLPPIAALMSILWVCFQFYHSAPVTKWRKDRSKK
jgi:hypothetical protein